MPGARTVLVVRHAKAGDRGSGASDRDRPLTPSGRAQADALPDLFAAFSISSVLSSPYRRCIETVSPLARRLRLEVTTAPELAEGSPVKDLLALLWSLDSGAALCSHGDVIGELTSELIELGLISSAQARAEKASTWVLGLEGVYIRAARYLPPPG